MGPAFIESPCMNCLPAHVLRQVFNTMHARGIFIRMIVLGFKLLNEMS